MCSSACVDSVVFDDVVDSSCDGVEDEEEGGEEAEEEHYPFLNPTMKHVAKGVRNDQLVLSHARGILPGMSMAICCSWFRSNVMMLK